MISNNIMKFITSIPFPQNILIIVILVLIGILYIMLAYILKYKTNNNSFEKFIFVVKKIIGYLLFIILIIIISIVIVKVYDFIYKAKNIVFEYEQLRLLKTYVKNLSRDRLIVLVEITDINKDQIVDFIITLFDTSEKKYFSKSYSIKGKEIYLDFTVINFDYVFIEKGNNTIVLPYRIFSDLIPYKDGIKLLSTTDEINNYLSAGKLNLYGLESNETDQIIHFVTLCLRDTSFAKKNGVRSIIGSAVHIAMIKGRILKIFAQNTGGITLNYENF